MTKPFGETVGIHLTDCNDVELTNNVFSGIDKAIVAVKSGNIKIKDNIILESIPNDLIIATLEAVRSLPGRSDPPTIEDVERAIKGGRIHSWLIDKCVDIASFSTSVIGLFK